MSGVARYQLLTVLILLVVLLSGCRVITVYVHFFAPFQSLHSAESTPVERVNAWLQVLTELKQKGDENLKIDTVNQFFNLLHWQSDNSLWRTEDYWATPLETLFRNGGDCEDLAIAKYFSLLELGVPSQKLVLTYARATMATPENKSNSTNGAHLVLLYRKQAARVTGKVKSTDLVLDNLKNELQTARMRSDLSFVYHFDRHNIWLADNAVENNEMARSRRLLPQWDRLLHRYSRQNN